MAGRRDNPTLVDLLSNAAFRAVIGVAMALPYDRRVAFVGWVTAHVIAPLAGYRGRVRANLALVRPDLSAEEVRRLARAVPDNAGRSLIEILPGRSSRSALPRPTRWRSRACGTGSRAGGGAAGDHRGCAFRQL